MHLDEGPGGLPASVRPTFEPKASSRGPIRNPLRKAPSMVNFDNGPQSELRGTAGASNGADAERSNAALKGSRQRGNVMTAREDRYIFDTGASKLALNTSTLTDKEKKHTRPLTQIVVADTYDGAVLIVSFVGIQLDKLGAILLLRSTWPVSASWFSKIVPISLGGQMGALRQPVWRCHMD